jgi:hypothetical protein
MPTDISFQLAHPKECEQRFELMFCGSIDVATSGNRYRMNQWGDGELGGLYGGHVIDG